MATNFHQIIVVNGFGPDIVIYYVRPEDLIACLGPNGLPGFYYSGELAKKIFNLLIDLLETAIEYIPHNPVILTAVSYLRLDPDDQ